MSPHPVVPHRWPRTAASVAALLLGLVLACLLSSARAAETIPAKPARYFNDYALAVKPETADRLNRQLEDFEKQTSNQILAVIYPRLQSDSSVDDFCQRVARAWQVGGKEKNNGAVLFVFLNDHKIWIATGYGMEGVLPDAICKRIIAEQISPRFKAGDFDGGMAAGVDAMIQASKGEYKGTGTTQYEREHPAGDAGVGGGLSLGTIIFLLIVAYFLFSMFRGGGRRGGGTMYTGGGPIIIPGGFGGGGSFGGGGGGAGGGGMSDGGGSFSSGGGDFGGGGAGGDW